MAYVVYFACDSCGREGLIGINQTVSFSVCKKMAREKGWKVGKRGWIYPYCQNKNRKG